MANGYWKTSGSGGVNSAYTYAQLAAKAIAGTLTPYATYAASNIGEEFYAPDEYTLTPQYAKVRCSLPGFGGTWDGSTDDTVAIQAAADYAGAFDPPRAIELPPLVCIKNSVFIPADVFVYGHNYERGQWHTTIYPHASMSLSTGYMLNLNTLDGINPVVPQSDGSRTWGGIFGLVLDNWNTNIADVRLCVFICTFIAEDIRGTRTTQLIAKPDGWYIDNITIERVRHWITYDESEYIIDIGSGGGDALTIVNCNFPSELPLQPCIKVNGSANVRIMDVINGGVYLELCANALVENYHCEIGSIYCDSSNVTIANSYIMVNDEQSAYPIECEASYYPTGTNYALALQNVVFVYGDNGNHESTANAQVNLVSQFALSVVNSYRMIRMSGAQVTTGIAIAKAGAIVTQWNDNSFYLSRQGSYVSPFATGAMQGTLGATMTGLWGPSASSSNGPSTLAATTYYYTCQLIFDVANLVGVNQSNAEVSITPTAGQRVQVNMGYGSNSSKQGIVRIYRGTATGAYDWRADIPSIGATAFVDSGAVISGVSWVAHGGGAVSTMTGGVGNYSITPIGGAVAL